MSSATTVSRNIEIVTLLCRGSVTAAALLSALQAAYPTVGWTLDMLNTLLAADIKSGLIVKLGNPDGTGTFFYGVNPLAVYVNPNLNKVYGAYCANIKQLPCNRANQTSFVFNS